MRQKGWMGSAPKQVTGVLDIGTSKIVCLIAANAPGPQLPDAQGRPPLRIIGVGHQKSRGVKGGVVTDLDEAEQAVRAAIAQAERMAGVMLESVHVSVSCGRLRSQNFTATADIESGVVSDDDIRRLLSAGQSYAEREGGRTLVHLNEVGLRLDGSPTGQDPRGMAASQLAADLHAVTADEAPLRNLLLVVERCYLQAASLVPAPYASAIAATSDEERRLGVVAVDIGGGTTTLSMFADDRFLFAYAAPWGGHHVTFDIARALHTPLAEAERIKALYGTLVSAQSDEHDTYSYPSAEEEGVTRQMARAELTEIIRPRIRVMAEHIREGIGSCGFARFANRCIVLTGGTSELTGIAEFVANEVGRPVRVGRPQAVSGLPPVASSPAFATAVGLLLAAKPDAAGRVTYAEPRPAPRSYLKQVGTWLKEGF